MTNTTLVSAIALAVFASTPAHAQLIGNGSVGVNGLGNSIAGSATGTVNRTGSNIRTSTITQARIQNADLPDLPDSAAIPGDVNAGVIGNATASTNVASTAATAAATTGASFSQSGIDASTLTLRGAEDIADLEVPSAAIEQPVAIGATQVVVPATPVIGSVGVRRQAIIGAGIAPIPVTRVNSYVDTQYRVIERDLAGTGAVVEMRGDQIVIGMPADVTFAFDKSDIRPRFYGTLNALSRSLQDYPATYVDVIGHTDAVGSDSYNMDLSHRRAGSVASFLTARSVNRSRIQTEGRGEFEPVASNASIEGRAANRRVEIILTPVTDQQG